MKSNVFYMKLQALNISLVHVMSLKRSTQTDRQSKTKLSLGTFSWHCVGPDSIHIQEKAVSGAHKARMGRGKMLWLHSVSPCCFLRNMCDPKDRVVTEGKAGIFNDSPRAQDQSKNPPQLIFFLGHFQSDFSSSTSYCQLFNSPRYSAS